VDKISAVSNLIGLPLVIPKELSREEIFAIEETEFDSGINVYDMMLKAGLAVAQQIKNNLGNNKSLLVLAGSGNNGGDGSIVAAELSTTYAVTIVYIADPKTKEAIKAKEMMQLSNVVQHRLEDMSEQKIKDILDQNDIILDAIFGIGLSKSVRSPIKEFIDMMVQHEEKIISLDIPSGLDCNTGEWHSQSFAPKQIITIQFSKKGFNAENEDILQNSKISIVDIGIQPKSYYETSAMLLKSFWPNRHDESHKGQNGRIMVIGGSDEFTGAPVLTGMATMRTGIDTLRIAVPETIRDIVASYAEDFIVVKVAGPRITSKEFKKYKDMAVKRHDVIVIGMGLSNHPSCTKFVREFFEFASSQIKFVIDAEAIRAFKDDLKLLKGTNSIITPHKRELKMLMGEDLPQAMPDLIKYVQNIALELEITILLKGKVDIITNGKRTLLNYTGHPGMTVGGTGDVLAGVVATCFAFIDNPLIAAAIGSFIMGKAGELCAKKYGNSLIASDIIKELPEVFKLYNINQ